MHYILYYNVLCVQVVTMLGSIVCGVIYSLLVTIFLLETKHLSD